MLQEILRMKYTPNCRTKENQEKCYVDFFHTKTSILSKLPQRLFPYSFRGVWSKCKNGEKVTIS